MNMSPKRAIELTHTMYEIILELPEDPHPQRILVQMSLNRKHFMTFLQ